MEYKGKLYGKFRGQYIPLLADTEQIDKMEQLLKESRTQLAILRRSMTAHPDCEKGSEFDDLTDSSQDLEDKIEDFFKSQE